MYLETWWTGSGFMTSFIKALLLWYKNSTSIEEIFFLNTPKMQFSNQAIFHDCTSQNQDAFTFLCWRWELHFSREECYLQPVILVCVPWKTWGKTELFWAMSFMSIPCCVTWGMRAAFSPHSSDRSSFHTGCVLYTDASADYSLPEMPAEIVGLYTKARFFTASLCLVFHVCMTWSLHKIKWTHDNFVKGSFSELLHFHLQAAE